MNAGGVLNTCKSYEKSAFGWKVSGARVSNAWVIYPRIGDNIPKGVLIPNKTTITPVIGVKDGLCLQAVV